MSLLAFLLRSSRGIVAASIAAGVVAGAGGVALIALIQAELARPAPSGGAIGLAFGGLCVVAAAARVAAQVAMVRLGQGAVTRLAVHLSRRVLGLSLERFERSDPAGLLAVLTGDLAVVSGVLVGVPQLCINVPLVVACFAYVAWLSPAAFACAAGFAALAIGVYLALGAAGMRHLRAARAGQDALMGDFRALVDGFRELKLHAGRRRAFLAEALGPHAAAVRDRSVAGQALFALAEGWSVLAFFGFLGVLLFALPGALHLDRPTLAGCVLVVLYVMSPLDVILTWFPALGRARASLQAIGRLIPALEAQGEEDRAAPPPAFREAIRLDGVTFAYPDEPGTGGFRLGPIDLEVRPGELVMLAGGNGSGKTTLVKLLAGLYDPAEGSITLDGRAVGAEDREGYRGLFSVVFADGYLFRELLGLDRPDLDERARAGLDRLGLAGRVGFAGRAFSTIDLSQGQRRRLALLGALLEGRPVCVFDECAANQDVPFKRSFYLELLPDLKAAGVALVVIGHDEDYFDVADRVVRLRDGRLVAEDRPVAGVGRD